MIDASDATSWDRAEAFALQGRNAKVRWLVRLEDVPGDQVPAAALRAAELKEAIDKYGEGFEQDLNHFYSGLNALSLLRIRNSLAVAHPDIWNEPFATDDDAQREAKASLSRFQQLAAAVQLSIQARQTFLRRQSPQDQEALTWAGISEADHSFLTASKAKAVRWKYAQALANASSFARDSVRSQLQIFQRVGVLDNVAEALAALDEAEKGMAASVQATSKPPVPGRVLLFTGHMIDAPGRPSPRFPPTKAAEAEARRVIQASIAAEVQLTSGTVVGLAGGACGGDILFHEICEELGIESRLYLALPKGAFSATSVQHAGKDWVERYDTLCARITPRVLAASEELPVWIRGRKDYSIWQRNNLWILFNALALDAKSLTLIALWDNGPADGPGGTKDLVAQVTDRGHKVDRLSAEQLQTLV